MGRRGLNRKTKSTNRFFGPNYPPVQNFSEKNDKKFLGTLSVFFVPLDFYTEKVNKSRDFVSPISLAMIFRIFHEVSEPSNFHKGEKTLMKRKGLSNINQICSPSLN